MKKIRSFYYFLIISMTFFSLMTYGVQTYKANCDYQYDLNIQKVCYCDLGGGTLRFWFEITNKNDAPVDYYWNVSTDPVTGSGTIKEGIGPSQTRLDYFYLDIPNTAVPGQLRLYRTCDDDFQQSIGFNPPNFDLCDRCPYPSILDPIISLIAVPDACIYTSPAHTGSYFTLTAYVYDFTLGALEGAEVTFSITSGQDIGEFTGGTDTYTTTTNADGEATVNLFHDSANYKAGDVTVSATAKDDTFSPDILTATDTTTVSFCPVCKIIELTADHYSLDAETPSTTLYATVKDYNDDFMPNGTVVNFVTTLGTISDVTTLYNGVATATLTYDDSILPAAAVVTTSTSCGTNEEITISFLEIDMGTLFLEALPSTVSLCDPTTTLYATYFNGDGDPIENATVTFEILGSPSGSPTLDPTNSDTNSNGIATTTLTHDETTPETVQIRSKVELNGTVYSNTIDVVFTAASFKEIVVLSPTNGVNLDTCEGGPLSIEIKVLDCNDNGIGGALIFLSTTGGNLVPDSVYTATDGTASAVLYPSGNVETVVITASCPFCGSYELLLVDFVAGDPCYIETYATPDRIPADERSISLITAHVYDCCGNPVRDGISVCFGTNAGTLIDGSQDDTVNGVASVPLKSSLNPELATVLAYLCSDPSIEDYTEVLFYIYERPENIWTPFVIMPRVLSTLSQITLVWDCLLENLPEELPEDIIESLEIIELRISNASSITNPIFAYGEMTLAMNELCKISGLLETECCKN